MTRCLCDEFVYPTCPEHGWEALRTATTSDEPASRPADAKGQEPA